MARAQVSTALHGSVADQQAAALPGATVVLLQASSGLERRTVTDETGRFVLPNLPTGVYDLTVSLSGFADERRRLTLSAAVEPDVAVTLSLAGFDDSVIVTPAPPAVDAESAGTRHGVSMTRIERMPVVVSSRGIESVLVAFPGFAQNANGAIHPRGAHNQMTFVVDGLPISDQLTGAFANSLDVAVVQTAELITGNIPAEFGGKVSGVAILNSRSGLGTTRPLSGSLSLVAGGFGTAQMSAQLGGERGAIGYFTSVTGFTTERFLDQVSRVNLHNDGWFSRGFGRVDARLRGATHLRAHAMGGISRFALANLRSQHAAGQDQRQSLNDVSTWASLLHAIDSASTFDLTIGYRGTGARLHPSSGDTPVTAAQERSLSTATLTGRFTRARDRQVLRVGIDVLRFPVRERFSMGLTSPTFNVPGATTYNDALRPYDLTRGGSPFEFADRRTGGQVSAFAQTTLHAGRMTINAGLRHDEYRFLVSGRQLQPRVGVAFAPGAGPLVFRASYNRNFQTPPNENLLLSSSQAASQLAPASVREAFGQAYRPIQPEEQDVFEVGAQFATGPSVTVDASVYHKRSRHQQDNNNFFDTGIIFPTSLHRIRVTGAEFRLTMLPRRGVSGSVSATTGRAIASPPFTGGLFLGQEAVGALSAGPFAIDHDQRFALHTMMTVDPAGPIWLSGSLRFDSGLVANPSDPATVAADPDYVDVLPYVDLTSSTPRVRARTIVDVAAGFDRVDGRGRRTWSAQLQVTNLTNRTALYNFQSVFVGTRLVQPRTLSLRVTRNL